MLRRPKISQSLVPGRARADEAIPLEAQKSPFGRERNFDEEGENRGGGEWEKKSFS